MDPQLAIRMPEGLGPCIPHRSGLVDPPAIEGVGCLSFVFGSKTSKLSSVLSLEMSVTFLECLVIRPQSVGGSTARTRLVDVRGRLLDF
jgi:hypothetical protein